MVVAAPGAEAEAEADSCLRTREQGRKVFVHSHSRVLGLREGIGSQLFLSVVLPVLTAIVEAGQSGWVRRR